MTLSQFVALSVSLIQKASLFQPNWFKLAEDVALYRSLNVSGMFMEGETGVSTPDLHEMRVWMLARLYFSPTASGPALMREFLDSFCKMAMLSRFVALSVVFAKPGKDYYCRQPEGDAFPDGAHAGLP